MARLPNPGGDNGNWGNILNSFLSQSLKSDGTLKDNIVTSTHIQNDAISEALLSNSVRSKLNALNPDHYVNVRDFGAVGDGITDDSAAIKAAEATMAAGKCLFFPAGDYRFATKHPTGRAAVALTGLSNVGIEFAPGARLLMDNLDADGLGTSNGILISGKSSHVSIINPTIKWKVKPAARGGNSHGIRIVGYPSDGTPAGGWLGSTGLVEYLTISNARVTWAPEAGIYLSGASDVSVLGSAAIETWADGLHFNACRRVTVNGHRAVDNGDDGLAFVNYYHPTQKWEDATIGPFWLSGLNEWCSSGSASAVTVSGWRSNGFRVQMGQDITIGDVSVVGKELGFSLNAAKIGPGQDWQSLASQNITVDNISISDVETGIVLGTYLITDADDAIWWDFKGCKISNVTLRNCGNWSLATETPDGDNTKLSGLELTNITAVAGDNTPGQEVGGHGGFRFGSLYNSTIRDIKLISDHETADIVFLGTGQIRGYVNGIEDHFVSVEDIPSSNLVIGGILTEGAGRILFQDIAGLSVGSVDSYDSNSVGTILYRVRDASFTHVGAKNPGRGSGVGRGLQIGQCFNVDIAEVVVDTDDHIGSLWQSMEIGSGNEEYPAGKGIRVDRLVYTSTHDDTVSDIAIQSGAYGPTDYYVQAYWLHKGEEDPSWRQTIYGVKNTGYLTSEWQHPTWLDPDAMGHTIDFNDITQAGRYFVVSQDTGFLFTGDTSLNQPPDAPGLLYLEVIQSTRGDQAEIIQIFTPTDPLKSGGFRSRIDDINGEGNWSDWHIEGTLSESVQASLAKADNSAQLAAIPWIDGPVDFDSLTTAGIYIVAGSFLNGDATIYNQPGNSGLVKLTVTTLSTPVDVVIQEYISVNGDSRGGQRRRWEGSWSGWMAY